MPNVATPLFPSHFGDYVRGGIGRLCVFHTLLSHITKLDCEFDVSDHASLAILTEVCPNVHKLRVWLSIHNDRTEVKRCVDIIRSFNLPSKKVTLCAQYRAPEHQTEPNIDAAKVSAVHIAEAMVNYWTQAFFVLGDEH